MIETDSLLSPFDAETSQEWPRQHKNHHNAASWPTEDESDAIKSLHKSLRSTTRIESSTSCTIQLDSAISLVTSKLYRSVSTEFPSSYECRLDHIDQAPTNLIPLLGSSGGTTRAGPGPIADSVSVRRSALSSLIKEQQNHSSQIQKIVAKRWLDRTLARGRRFTLAQTSNPMDPTASSWTLVKRLPPGPSRLCLKSPGHASLLVDDLYDVPEWALGLVRINQSPSSSFNLEAGARSLSSEAHFGATEREKSRGGCSALRALMDEALSC